MITAGWRLVVLLASVTGLLLLPADPVLAWVPGQHCEPLVRR
jgi:hypothetical protein